MRGVILDILSEIN